MRFAKMARAKGGTDFLSLPESKGQVLPGSDRAAWLNKKAQIENGGQVDSRDIKKHFKDVIALSALLTEGMAELPERMDLDLRSFLGQVPAELASNPIGYRGVDGDRLITAIREAFGLR